ncbi:MAG: methyl-accepting chemotaxis protein [Lachnospiraceae bacterium]|nr:methyl-accepting chemotaxis protein [Lachnospiraceae bacterium]
MGDNRNDSGNIIYDGIDPIEDRNIPDEVTESESGDFEYASEGESFVEEEPVSPEEDKAALEKAAKEQTKLEKKAAKEQAALEKKAAKEQARLEKKAAKEKKALEKKAAKEALGEDVVVAEAEEAAESFEDAAMDAEVAAESFEDAAADVEEVAESFENATADAEEAADAVEKKSASFKETCKKVLCAVGGFFAGIGRGIASLYRKIRGIEDISGYDLDGSSPGRKSRQLRRYTKIRWKLMAAFILPVILIVVVGLVSYNMASETVISKCNLSVSSTMSATDKYLKLMLSSVKNKAATLSTDADVTNYYYNLFDRNITDPTTKKAYNATYNSMGGYIKQTDYLEDYYILCNQGRPTFSYKKTEAQTRTADPAMFLPYWDTEEAKPFADGKSAFWTLSHPFIDETFWGEPDTYCMTFVRLMKNKDGIIAFDIKKDSMHSTLGGTGLGDGSIVGLVFNDHEELNVSQSLDENGNIVAGEIMNDVMFNAPELSEYVMNEELDGITTEISYDGDTYLFYRSGLGDSDIVLCALVPEENLASELTTIRFITILFVLIGAAIALGTGLLISSGIAGTLKKTCTNLSKVADGDLSQTFETTRTDEIGQLTDTIDKTVLGIHSIVEEVTRFSEDVNMSSARVAKTTNRLVSSMKMVSGSLGDVYSQVQSQAVDTDTSADKMAILSKRIDAINDNTRQIDATVDKTVDISEKGRKTIASLNEQNNITTDNINHLVADIDGVVKKAMGISKITETMNEIAEQTNLLSLNASIEAARAGEQGRGFSVVAEEIHKLADESIKAGDQINKIIGEINESTQNAVNSAKMTNKLVSDQSRILIETNSVFSQINDCIDEMANQLESIMRQLHEMTGDKNAVSSSIENIVAVAAKVSEATKDLGAQVEDQVRMMEQLAEKTAGLSTQASELNQNMESFIL